MDRITLESKLNRDRAWLLDALASLNPEDLVRGATPSEHDANVMWSPLDHFVHLALIEHNFAAMIRRHVAGDANPVGLLTDKDGKERSREDIMAGVHAMTENWATKHRGKPLSEAVAVTQAARAETIKLLAELTDEQLAQKLPGAPWADGTIGGVLGANADHGRMHWKWMKDGFAAQGITLADG
jgi:hypothetical protein